jgi:UDP-4-amino-4,6-dideoxy-N-acetyl-beta-L-altrosamine transaminase
MIPYGKQDITQQDIDAVVDVLKSDFLTQGPQVPKFEGAMANATNAKFALAVNSATSALHLACLALGVSQGDVVWTTAITFVASANCALYCGADIDFVDIDPQTFNISIDSLAAKLESAASSKATLPKVVVAVHMCGQPCDMARIMELSNVYGFKIIEDASHAIGSKYKGQPTGNCAFSDITIFSFHPVKIITTAEGGMALTNNAELDSRMRLLSSHGVTRDPSQIMGEPTGGWYYEQIELGYNYRMTELQAALGVSQMTRLDQFINKRHELVDNYSYLLKDLPVELPWSSRDSHSSFHLYVIRLKLDQITLSHAEVFKALRDRGIGVNLHYMPVYMQPYYQKLGFSQGYCPHAEKYSAEVISLPMYPNLSESDQVQVCNVLKEILYS